nr:unnamed protein product [Spirometra erinaceieuropaei]
MSKDLKAWTRVCIAFQRSKVRRHNRDTSGTFPGPGARFSHVHLNIVCPLPLSNGCTYLLTCVDRFTRWPEAIPLSDTAAPTVVKALLSRCVAIFGVPSTITTDRGAHFESHLFQSLLSFSVSTRIRTTVYHPAANRMVDRFHRQLKASLRAAADRENWTDHLPLVLLGIRSASKSDLDCSAAELVFRAIVRLPGEMISPTPRETGGPVHQHTFTASASTALTASARSLTATSQRHRQGPPTSPRCHRTNGHLRTNCSTRNAPTVVSSSTTPSPLTPSPNVDPTPQPPPPSSSSAALTSAAVASFMPINSTHHPDTPTPPQSTPVTRTVSIPVLIVIAHSPHKLTWSVTCESITHRLANPCLEQQLSSAASAFTFYTAIAHSCTAWAYSATCKSTRAELTAPSTHPPRQSPPPLRRPVRPPPSPQLTPTPPTSPVHTVHAHLPIASAWSVTCE